MEKERESREKQRSYVVEQIKIQSVSDEVKESKLDMLRLEVEQMRNMVSQFKMDHKDLIPHEEKQSIPIKSIQQQEVIAEKEVVY